LAPLPVGKIPGVGRVMEKNLHALGISRVSDLAKLDATLLEKRFGKWGLTLAGKAQGLDAGGWYDQEVGTESDPMNIPSATIPQMSAASNLHWPRLSQMVGRRLRENGLFARTVQLKLRYKDFSTITRAHSLKRQTQLDGEILHEALTLFRKNWERGAIRLLGIQASSLNRIEPELDLLNSGNSEMAAAAYGG
jgi:DNA polymerase-4